MSTTISTDAKPARPVVEPLESRQLLAAAELDPTFGDQGKVELAIGEHGQIDDLIALADGGIIATATSSEGRFLLRFGGNGALDPNFGTNGRRRIGQFDRLKLLPDGNILRLREREVRRYNSNWKLDRSFGKRGVLRTGFPLTDAAVQPNGKLLAVAGSKLMRYQENGRLDRSFGDRGRVRMRFEDLYEPEDRPGVSHLVGVDVQRHGRIIVGGGIALGTATQDGRTGTTDFILARFRSDGTLDRSFGRRGRRIVARDHADDVTGIAMRPDGSMLVNRGGDHDDGSVILIDRDGKAVDRIQTRLHRPAVAVALDGRFAVIEQDPLAIQEWEAPIDQRPKFAFSFTLYPLPPVAPFVGQAIAYQPDGKVLGGGSNSDGHLILVRLQAGPSRQIPFTSEVQRASRGRIEAEDFDHGGEGVSYHDADPHNRGESYRSSGVDVRPITDRLWSDFAIAWTRPGEWLEYTVQVNAASNYNIFARVANPAPGGRFHVEIDGRDVTGSITVPDTGAWDRYTTIASGDVTIDAGEHVVRLVLDEAAASGAVGSFNWLQIVEGIDVTFGQAGLVKDLNGHLVPHPDGSTVVLSANPPRFVRLSPDGDIELSTEIGFDLSSMSEPLLQPDGRILVPVITRDESATGLLRLNADGTIDQSFGQDGFAPSPRSIKRLGLQPDGRILAGGGSRSLTGFFLLRYTASGQLDETFAGAFHDQDTEFIGASADGSAHLVTYGQGLCVADEIYGMPECPRFLFIRRLRPDGSTDASYGNEGLATVVRPESHMWASDPTFWGQRVLPDGSVVSGERHLDYNRAWETSVIAISADGATENTLTGRSEFNGKDLHARHDGLVVLVGTLDLNSPPGVPYDEHYALLRPGRHTPWPDLYGPEEIWDLAFAHDGGILVLSHTGITKFRGIPLRL